MIDLVDELQVTRQHPAKQRHRPALERLGQDGVVGVGKGPGRHLPGCLPIELLEVDQQPHELGDGERRVRIVELDGRLVREAGKHRQALRRIEHLPALLVAAQDVLQGRRDEEVLLLEPEFLALKDIVVGVEDLGDVLGTGLGLDRPLVVTAVEIAQVELVGGPGRPQAQRIDGAILVARDRRIVGEREHIVGVDPGGGQTPLGIDVLVHAPVELDAEEVVRARNLPGVAIPQPGVGGLHLIAVDNALMEHAILVAQPVSIGGQCQGRQ